MNKTQLQQLRAKSTLVKKLGEDEEFDMDSFRKPKVDIFVRDLPVSAPRMYDAFISGGIDEDTMFHDLINFLRSATQEDLIILNINSHGGRTDITKELLFEINTTQAHTIAQVVGYCASAATQIALACDEVFAEPDSEWLFHGVSYTIGGSHSHIKTHTDFIDRVNERWLELYEPYLTKEEIQMMRDGKDVLLLGDEVMERIEAAQQAAQENPIEVEGLLPEDTTHVELPPAKPKRKSTKKVE